MHKLALVLALFSVTACGKKKDGAADDKATPPAADMKADPAAKTADPATGDLADVDCDKMMTHMEPIMVKAATEGKTPDEVKAAEDQAKTGHAAAVKACEDEKATKKMTKAEYACVMAAATMNDVAACAPKQ